MSDRKTGEQDLAGEDRRTEAKLSGHDCCGFIIFLLQPLDVCARNPNIVWTSPSSLSQINIPYFDLILTTLWAEDFGYQPKCTERD
jgi:hypothetical protein